MGAKPVKEKEYHPVSSDEYLDSFITMINSHNFTFAATLINPSGAPFDSFMKFVYYGHIKNPNYDIRLSAEALLYCIQYLRGIECYNVDNFEYILLSSAELAAYIDPYRVYKGLVDMGVFLSVDLQAHFVTLDRDVLCGDKDLLCAQNLYKSLVNSIG